MSGSGWSAAGLALIAGLGVAAAQTIDVPAGQKEVLTVDGRGVQIYRCAKTGDAVAWEFVAPEARLFVRSDEVGTHGAGPVWTYGGGTVQGKMVASLASPELGSVPWLLLKAVSSTGHGPMTQVTYIRRTETKGGMAKNDGCDADHLGTLSRVPYTATYTFYARAD